jgi:hypothetical protein
MDSTLSRVAQAAPTHSIQVTALEAALRIDSAKCVRRVSRRAQKFLSTLRVAHVLRPRRVSTQWEFP